MGGPRLVEGEARAERPGDHLVGHEVVEHEHVGLLDELGAGHPLGAEQHVDGDRGRGDLGHEERLQVEVAGELLVEAPLGVPPVDQARRPGPASCALPLNWGRPGRGAVAPWRRFQRAITLV